MITGPTVLTIITMYDNWAHCVDPKLPFLLTGKKMSINIILLLTKLLDIDVFKDQKIQSLCKLNFLFNNPGTGDTSLKTPANFMYRPNF